MVFTVNVVDLKTGIRRYIYPKSHVQRITTAVVYRQEGANEIITLDFEIKTTIVTFSLELDLRSIHVLEKVFFSPRNGIVCPLSVYQSRCLCLSVYLSVCLSVSLSLARSLSLSLTLSNDNDRIEGAI